MSFLDKAKDAISEHKDQVKDGIEKAGDLIDEKTDGKFADKIDAAQEKASDFVENSDS